MSQLTTYNVQVKGERLVLVFKYGLSGHLKSFEVNNKPLELKSIEWLFIAGNFPATEAQMKGVWMKEHRGIFDIKIAPPDISFEALWKLYNLKVKKDASEKAFNKLSESDKIKCFTALRAYEAHLKTTGQAKAHLVTWINQKRFNDEY